MNDTPVTDWYEFNQRSLTAALAAVRQALERHAARAQGAPEAAGPPAAAQPLPATTIACAPPALETLCELFDLSPFERAVLLLCAGMELDGGFAALCAAAQGDARRAYPTFGLALAALPGAHWSALSPARPLRRWRLVELRNGDSLTQGPLQIDERVLHYLTGMPHLDERLAGFVEPLPDANDLAPSHRVLAEQLVATWKQAVGEQALPVVQICGEESASQRAVAAAACAALGLALHVMPAQVIPLDPREIEALMRLWEREAMLGASALLLDCGEMDTSDAFRESAIVRLLEGVGSPLIVAGRERRSAPRRPMITMEVHKPTAAEQRALWQSGLGAAASNVNGRIEALAAQFSLSVPAIHAICAEALGRAAGSPAALGEVLWDVCRAQARPRLDNLAQRIAPAAAWDDLVLPEAQQRILQEIAAHVRQRMQVYETWGFAAKSARGLGISALFAGASGTGKTMAAEVLANKLRLDLYRIDLSQVVNKYIGETEKNLRRVFDAAEESGAILLFDEADALFGKRSEVKDSHDRYANIEVSYLLQRMESYRGLAILTTNMKSALDNAFLRRIRFVVQFPFPDAVQRAEIWRRVFPAAAPTEGLDVRRLAQLNVAGGNIRNIALYAAFLAAEAQQPVQMRHLLRAAQVECAKLERPLTDVETGGWM
jgi:hypothetical protein